MKTNHMTTMTREEAIELMRLLIKRDDSTIENYRAYHNAVYSHGEFADKVLLLALSILASEPHYTPPTVDEVADDATCLYRVREAEGTGHFWHEDTGRYGRKHWESEGCLAWLHISSLPTVNGEEL